jgi:glycosyltransferase involved in cell wall biosynthesis
MHIIQVTPRFPPAIGGVEEHVYRISIELLKRGHKVTVVTSTEVDGMDCPLKNELVKGIRVYRLPLFMPKTFRETWFIPSIMSILPKLKGDVIHTHGYRCISSFCAVSIAYLMQIPVILTPHGIYPPRSFSNALLKSVFDHSFGRPLLHFSDRIIALSEHNVRLLQGLGAQKERIALVPNGVSMEEFETLERSKESFRDSDPEGPVLLFVGRIDWNKQIEKLVESMPLVLKTFQHAKLVIVGPDYANCANQLLRLAEQLKVKNSLVVTGKVSADELKRFYSAADVFLLPSSYEGFGLSMIEAMASKIPVIASSAGGPGDILKHGVHAWLLENVTPESVYRAVRTVLANQSLRETLVSNGFSLVKEEYTWEKVAGKLEQVYEQAAMK